MPNETKIIGVPVYRDKKRNPTCASHFQPPEWLAELQLKAEEGDHSSQYLLGRAYYWGMGVKEDEKKGDLWFACANESCRRGEREKSSFQNSATTTQPQ